MWQLLWQTLSQMVFFVLQVVNSYSFPRPLSAKEEREALLGMKNGDKQARQKLIEHNLRLVAHIIRKRYAHSPDQEDLISIGTVGLIKAIDSFDVEKGVRLTTYAARCIENEILMTFRAEKKRGVTVSLEEPIDMDSEGHPLTLMDILATEDTVPEELEQKINGEKLSRYMRECLNDRERDILSLRYGLAGKPLTQWQIAETMGISRSYVSRLETKALLKLRERFEQGDVRKKKK